MKTDRITKRLLALLLAAVCLFALCACGNTVVEENAADREETAAEPEHDAEEIRRAVKPEEPEEVYPGPDVELTEYDGVVEHLFFHPVIAYPEMAFRGDYMEQGLDDWMLTVSEYDAILDRLYENGYILVDIGDVWGLETDAEETGPEDTENAEPDAGKTDGRDKDGHHGKHGSKDSRRRQNWEEGSSGGRKHVVRKKLMLPKGKKPLIISYDDVNYYEYMREYGFTYKLIVKDGKVWSWGLDPQGKEVVSRDLDAVTILDKFVEEHPDFSMYGVKGCIALTGYEGILGYRTQTSTDGLTAEQEKQRQEEIKAVGPVIDALKENGWYFGSHTWGHIDLSGYGVDGVASDTQRWKDEVASLVGDTPYLFYPHGARPDGDDFGQTGSVFEYLYGQGYRVFFSVGIESFSHIKEDIPAVIADRMHPDGTTLRWNRDRYMRFYDAKDVFDYDHRPDLGRDW